MVVMLIISILLDPMTCNGGLVPEPQRELCVV